MVHTEATLKGLNKPDLIKLVLKLESEMNSDIKELTSEIRDLVAQMKKVEADVAIVKNVNEKLVNQLIETERQFKMIVKCHRLKDNDRVVIKLSNSKDSLQVLRVKKYLKSLEPTELDFPEGTRIFINESLCAYSRGLWNKCKKLKGMVKLHVFFVSNGLIKVKILENDRTKPITHAVDLKKMFPDMDIHNL